MLPAHAPVITQALMLLDRANRKKNIVLKGVSWPINELKERVENFLSEYFNISESISVEILHKETNNLVSMVRVTLESLEAKMYILKNKKVLFNLRSTYVQPDLTDLERKIGFKLRDFARKNQAAGKKTIYVQHTVKVNDKWYCWDEKLKSVIPCPRNSVNPGIPKIFNSISTPGSFSRGKQI